MAQDEKVSRYEVNRNVRMVLARHDADLSRVDYSFTGNTVYLYGDLIKPHRDFSPKEIEDLAREISSLQHVRDIQFDLNNWKLISAGGSWTIAKTKKFMIPTGAVQDDSSVVLENPEELSDVLEDIQPDKKK
jgi:hypothetical protein